MVQEVDAPPWSRAGHALPHALEPYLPRLLGDWLEQTPDLTHRTVEGTLLFADISGFTSLTERLARLGRVGAEEMSDALSATFTELLGEARADDADLLKWGGDAVLLLFTGAGHAVRACRTAVRMRARLRTVGRLSTSAGHARLRMSVGVHTGRFALFLVGDPATHRELVVCGPDVTTLVGVEAAANAGQVALSPATAALLDPALLGAAVDDVGVLLRREPRLPVPPPSVVGRAWSDRVAVGFPVAIRERLLQGAIEPEHRQIAVAFVAFSGTDRMLAEDGPEATAAALDAVVRNVAGAVADHKVTFFESDINRDGGKIMLTAGAPASAGHDAERLLRASRLIVERAGELPLRVGVNLGSVFCGDFGPAFRRTYSVKGDAINLAARLVARAEPGQVLATAAVPQRSATAFRLRSLPPFTVKGKARPVHAVDVGPVSGGPEVWRGSEGPLVGRAAERAALGEAVARLGSRRGGSLDVVGDAGLGKSRLVAEVRRLAAHLTVLAVTCDEYESSTPYHAFGRLLRDVLGVRPGSPPDLVTARLEARVRDNAPDLLDRLPLLGVPLGVSLPDNELTRGLTEEFRKRRAEEATLRLLHVLLPTPTVLLVDDAHHLDSASGDLLDALVRRTATEPWLVVTARRDRVRDEGWAGPAGAGRTLRLAPLTSEESVALLRAATEDRPLPRQTTAAIAARAGGNPLFLESLIAAADPSGAVTALPETVQDVVTTQVDALAPADRLVLRYASVLGGRFNTHELADLVLGRAPAPDQGTYRRLGAFLVRDEGASLRFRHALMREVAYHGLPFRTRQRLHARVAERLERADPDGSPELLSLHFLEARRFDKAWHHARRAARHARSRYAQQEAVDLYARALEAERRGPRGMVPPGELGELLEELGDTWFAIGLPDQAADAYRRARRHLADDPVRAARVVAKEARIDQRLRRLPQSLRRVSRALHRLEEEPGRWASSARSLLAMRYAISRLAQGRVAEALEWGHQAATDAEESVDKPTLAQAYANLYGIYVAAGLEPPVPYGELALQAYTELGDLPHQADCTNNLAVSALDHGRWTEAVDAFRRAAGIYRRIGDTQGEGLATYNRAEVLVRQGRLDEAAPLLDDALHAARAVSDDELVALVLREQGRVACRRGAVATGLDLLAEALRVFTGIDEPEELASTHLAVCEGLLVGEGDDTERAAACLDRLGALQAAADSGELDLDPVRASVHRVRATALVLAGRTAEGLVELRAALEVAAAAADRFEEALARLGLAHLEASVAGEEPDPGRVVEAEDVLARLGVVALHATVGVT
ncbi:MAG TPA: adenylate/guanylate cyclase domain-containing protein [Nocardioides sp.]|nr:adenylate/guanylate cyclase domain-containing protein [Nocardioides sp.]